ncbi:FixH family protein [Sneathiella glossodoripedis]|uniref:FixH family protein n=1 Tax=Sneathiella glossodoripedis TaxID=418853 RepID=UPI00046F9888|nr:FixH family protein [Sneathiella glossodoripedis]
MAFSATRPITGKHVLAMLVGFFLFMLIANGFFLYFALTSFSGLSTEDPYKKGLNYNQALLAKEQQIARGWKPDLNIRHGTNGEVMVTLNVLDATDQPVRFTDVKAVFWRPAVQGEDVDLVFSENGNELTAAATLDKLGNWELRIELYDAAHESPYRLEKRIWIK